MTENLAQEVETEGIVNMFADIQERIEELGDKMDRMMGVFGKMEKMFKELDRRDKAGRGR